VWPRNYSEVFGPALETPVQAVTTPSLGTTAQENKFFADSSMKICLFSQSLFALFLDEAIGTAAEVGFSAIELACWGSHLHT